MGDKLRFSARAKLVDQRPPAQNWSWRETWPLDVGLAATAVIAVITKSVVVPFHVIFLLLAVAALMLPFRQFAIRTSCGLLVSVMLLFWAVTSLDVPPEELTEIPILTAVLVLIFLVAQSRSHEAAERESAHAQLTQRADAELESLRCQLVHSQRLDILGRTSVGLAHDLRNVLTVIRGCSSDYQCTDDRFVSECAREVADACTRAESLVDELLWVGRQHHTALTVLDLGKAVSELGPILQRLTERGVRLTVDCPDHPVPVRFDKMSVTQILMNLVANANDAVVGSSGNITVSVKSVLTNHPDVGAAACAVLSVADDGTGFDPTTAQNAFRADFTTKGTDHSGLGLHTVAQLADRCGGSVRIESGNHRETVVSVTIPLDNETVSDGDDVPEEPQVRPDQIVRSALTDLCTDDLDTIASRSTSRLI